MVLSKRELVLIKTAQENLINDLEILLQEKSIDNWNQGFGWIRGYISAMVSSIPGTYIFMWMETRDQALKMIDHLPLF
jgi:hypothetical protein